MPVKYTPYLKVMLPNHQCTHVFNRNTGFPLELPVGKWLPKKDPIPCVSGYHFCRNYLDLAAWHNGSNRELWVVYAKGRRNDDFNKGVAEQIKLVQKLEFPVTTPWSVMHDYALPACELLRKARYWGDKAYSKYRYNAAKNRIKNWHRTYYGKAVDEILKFNNIDPMTWGDQ